MEDLLRWLGEQVGEALRLVTELLTGTFGGIDDFFAGFTSSLGMQVSVSAILLLILGVYLLYSGIRRLLGRSLIGGVIRLALAALLLGWAIN